MKTISSIFILILLFPAFLMAQDDLSILKKMYDEDPEPIEALALYPDDVRNAILEASLYPQALVKINDMQQRTKQDFKNLLMKSLQNDQEQLFELTRYPKLIDQLTSGPQKTEDEINVLMQDYPEEIHNAAREQNRNNHRLLVEIRRMNLQNNNQFQLILHSYPANTQDAIYKLADLPEVLEILTDNIPLMLMVGDVYRKDPEGMRHKVDSFSLKIARKNTKAVQDWQQSLKDNPEAQKEMEEAAVAYAEEEGYIEEDYNAPRETEQVEIHHYYHPYAWWYGSPWWYSSSRWYHYPYWYHWGYYYGPGRVIVYTGFPSWHFMNWHFGHHHHFYHYPHLSHFYFHHYDHHHHYRTPVYHAVHHWKERERGSLSSNLLNDDGKRPDRLKEYGRLQMDYDQYKKNDPNSKLSRADYYDKNVAKYPTLKPREASEKDIIRVGDQPKPTPAYTPEKPDYTETKDKTRIPPYKNVKPRPSAPPKTKTPVPKKTYPSPKYPDKKSQRPTYKPKSTPTPKKVTPPPKKTVRPPKKSPPSKTPRTPGEIQRMQQAKDAHKRSWEGYRKKKGQE